MKVPKDMVQHEGRKYITESLHTGDIRTAKARRDIRVGRLRERWQRLRERGSNDPSSTDWLRNTLGDLREDLRSGSVSKEDANLLIHELLEEHLKHYEVRPKPDGSRPQDLDDQHDISEEHATLIRDAVASIDRPADVTLSEVVRVYLEETKQRVRLKSYNEKKKFIEMLRDHVGPDRPMRNLGRAEAREFIREVIMQLPVDTSTRRKVYSIVNAFGQWSADVGYSEDNPFAGMGKRIKPPVRGVKRDNKRRPWAEDELVKFFTFEGVKPMYWKVWYGCALLLLTGARRGEILNRLIEDVIMDDKGLDVRDAKNESSVRVIPLHPLAQPLVKKLADASTDGYLLPGYPAGGEEKDDRGNAFLKQFGRVRKLTTKVGPNQGLVLHSFRHTFETAAANHGIDQRYIDEIAGHSHAGGTGQRIYLHGIEFERCLEALETLSFGTRVDELLRNPPDIPPARTSARRRS